MNTIYQLDSARGSLREGTLADQAVILELIGEYFAHDEIDFDEARVSVGLKKLLEDASLGRVFLIFSQEAVAGYLILTFGFDLEFGGRQATMTDLFLRPTFRRTGLGTEVFQRLEQICSRLGVKAIELQAERHNLAAQKFYAKLGFEAHDRTPFSKVLNDDPIK